MILPIVGNEYAKKVIPLLDSAKKNIDIVVYDWRFYPDRLGHPVTQFNLALIRAVRRGVIVRAVLNNGLIVRELVELGIKARIFSMAKTVHAKLILVDNETLVIGSHNFTSNAFTSNIEVSVMIDLSVDDYRFTQLFSNLYGL